MNISHFNRNPKAIGLGLAAGGLIAVVSLENYFRHKKPRSFWRPTRSLEIVTFKTAQGFRVVGFYFARATNVCEFVKEYLAEDLMNVTGGGLKLVLTPLMMLRGYYDYYVESVTPIRHGIISTAVIGGFSLVIAHRFGFVSQPNWWLTERLSQLRINVH